MSGTLGASKQNVKRLMRQFPAGSSLPLVPDETIVATINSWNLQLNAIFSLADTWSLNAVTLVAGTRLYQLSSTDYQTLAMLRRSTDGVILDKVSELHIQSLYQSPNAATGNPKLYALWEGTDEKLNIDLYPTPDATAVSLNTNLDAFISTTVATLVENADVIYLPPTGLQTLELMSASECLIGIKDDLSKALAARGQMMLDTEKERRAQFRRQDYVMRVRF